MNYKLQGLKLLWLLTMNVRITTLPYLVRRRAPGTEWPEVSRTKPKLPEPKFSLNAKKCERKQMPWSLEPKEKKTPFTAPLQLLLSSLTFQNSQPEDRISCDYYSPSCTGVKSLVYVSVRGEAAPEFN